MADENKTKRPLVILREVYDIALSGINRNYVLFGHKNALKDSETNYDLIFHAIPGIPKDSLEKIISLVIPVLPENFEGKSYEIESHELAKKYPWLEMVAVEDNQLYTGMSLKGKRIIPKSLKFLNIDKTSLGTQLKDIGKYEIVDEEKLSSLHSDPEEFLNVFRKCKKIIDDYYQ